MTWYFDLRIYLFKILYFRSKLFAVGFTLVDRGVFEIRWEVAKFISKLASMLKLENQLKLQ